MLTLTIAGFVQGMLATLFVVFCLLLCLIILIQKPKGGGLSGAFGGAGGGGGVQVFGGKSGDILTWITVSLFALFIFVGILLVTATRIDAKANRGVKVAPAAEAPAGLPDINELPATETNPPAPTLDTPATPKADAPAPTPPPAAPAPAPAPEAPKK